MHYFLNKYYFLSSAFFFINQLPDFLLWIQNFKTSEVYKTKKKVVL